MLFTFFKFNYMSKISFSWKFCCWSYYYSNNCKN